MRLTKKQNEVLKEVRKKQPKITVLYGGKRAGKTFLAILMFLSHVANYEGQGLSFVIGGVNRSSIERNVISEIELLTGMDIKLDQASSFQLFGNRVYCFDGALASSWKKARGFTSAGALLNEATALHDSFIKEIISRCSYRGARIIADTNPESPSHPIKKDYIDKSGQKLSTGRTNILSFHFTLFDNETLDEEYVESIVQSTPSGAFTDRDIYGRWVSREGAVYSDFDRGLNGIEDDFLDSLTFDRIIIGVDWGYEHYGSMIPIGVIGDEYFILDEFVGRHMDIEYWSGVAETLEEQYIHEYPKPTFYCDSARPEYIARLQEDGRDAIGANKSIIPGVAMIGRLIKTRRLKVPIHRMARFEEEIDNYVWDIRNDRPKQEYDDVLDAVRYAIFSDYLIGEMGAEQDYQSQMEVIRQLGLA